MTNHEIAINACRNLESNPVYMNLVTRYEQDPNSLSDKEFRMMMDLADAAMPSFEEWSLLTELGFIDDD
jgi:hypothetical protein